MLQLTASVCYLGVLIIPTFRMLVEVSAAVNIRIDLRFRAGKRACMKFEKRREKPRKALKPSEKKQMDYSIVTHRLKPKLSFNLLRSAVLYVRGSKTTKHELNIDFSGTEIANVFGKIK